MKAPKPPDIIDYIPKNIDCINPTEKSKIGLSVPELIFLYGNKKMIFKRIPFVFSKMIITIINVKKSYKDLKLNPQHYIDKVDSSFIEELEIYAKKLGCKDIGYTDVPRDYIFKNRKILYKNAIVLTMDMKKEKMSFAPGLKATKEIWRTYATLGITVNKISQFLRASKYCAQPGPALGGEVNYPLLAQKACMGAIGKNGMLISKSNGPSQRIAVIYTNITNLPFTKNNEYEWIPGFCNKCNRCVKKCPSEAIYKQSKILSNGSIKNIDYKKCMIPFSESMGCSICIKECVFLKSGYDNIKKNFKSN